MLYLATEQTQESTAIDDLLVDVQSVIEQVTLTDPTRRCDENNVFMLLEARVDLPRPDRVKQVADLVMSRSNDSANSSQAMDEGGDMMAAVSEVLSWFPDAEPNEVQPTIKFTFYMEC